MPITKVKLLEQVSGYFVGAKATIEAISGVAEGSLGYATDTNELGSYSGSTWTWGQGFDLAAAINGATEKTTVDGSDRFIITDSGASFALKRLSYTNLYTDVQASLTADNTWIPVDGWVPRSETWTRTGNHVFTVSGDVTARYRKGTKVRYKDGGGNEYGVVASSSHSGGTTTVTLITNSDYAMAAATITDKYISHIANPEGFPTSFNFSTTITYDGGTTDPTSNTVNVAKWRVNGSDIFFTITSTLVRGSGNRTRTIYSIPVTPSAISIMPGMDTVGTGALALAVVYAYTDAKIYYEKTMAANGDYYINGSFAL